MNALTSLMVVGVSVAAASAVFRFNKQLKQSGQSLPYYLYASTRLGQFIHNRQLSSATARRVDTMAASSSPLTLSSVMHKSSKISIHLVPYLQDNHAYVVLDEVTRDAVIVDPGDPIVATEALQELDASLKWIITTHKHADHAGGNEEMARLHPGIKIVGPEHEAVAGATYEARDGELLPFGRFARFRTLSTPCHTLFSACFLLETLVTPEDEMEMFSEASEAWRVVGVFSGDTLFQGGAGKFFEGGAESMVKSCSRLIEHVPEHALVFPGHEYTQSNLEFATFVDPSSEATSQRLAWAKERRARGETTIPSTMGDELAMNPFLRGSMGKDEEFADKVKTLSLLHRPVVATGADRAKFTQANPAEVRDAGDAVQIVRALRALKDAGIDKPRRVVRL